MSKDLPPGYPRFKEKKPKKFGSMSYRTQARMEERKEVILETHKRSGGRCEAAWIAPDVRCSSVLYADEKHTRGRFGGVTAYDINVTQSLCSRCDFCKENEIWAAEILGLFGTQGKTKHEPISQEDIVEAKKRFEKRKRGAHF